MHILFLRLSGAGQFDMRKVVDLYVESILIVLGLSYSLKIIIWKYSVLSIHIQSSISML